MKNIQTLILFILFTIPAAAHAEDIRHIVMVWMADGTTEQQIQEVILESRKLSRIPGVTDLKVGRAIPSQRKIVDDSFDIGISMQFPDSKTMNTYIKHPNHVTFVNQHIKGKVKKLVVYDF